MRTATEADIEPLADFNVRIHGDELHRAGTWDELGGGHPTLTLRHQLLVEEPASGAIISAAYLLPMRWRLGSVELPVGQIEAVGTDPGYRRRGLSRRIIEALHGIAASQGQLLTGITGVRYLYRRFGYEYAAALERLPGSASSGGRGGCCGLGRASGPPASRTRRRSARCAGHGRTGWTWCRSSIAPVSGSTSPATSRSRSWPSTSRSPSMVSDRPIAYAGRHRVADNGWASVTEVVLGAGLLGSEGVIVQGARRPRAGHGRCGGRRCRSPAFDGGSVRSTRSTSCWRLTSGHSIRRMPGTSACPMRRRLLRAIAPVLEGEAGCLDDWPASTAR